MTRACFVKHNQITLGGKRVECPNKCREKKPPYGEVFTGVVAGLDLDKNKYYYDCLKCGKEFYL